VVVSPVGGCLAGRWQIDSWVGRLRGRQAQSRYEAHRSASSLHVGRLMDRQALLQTDRLMGRQAAHRSARGCLAGRLAGSGSVRGSWVGKRLMGREAHGS
jgi:hypothetical protein